jgi:hypothetical protein
MVMRARFWLAVLLAIVLGAKPVALAGADDQPPLAPSVTLAQIDAQIENKWATFVTWQENYRAANGVYFQGLRSHRGAVPDSNGRGNAPTGLDDRPTDRSHALREFWNGVGMPNNTPFEISIDVYSGPAGDGFTVTLLTVDGGQTMRRVLNHGPETWREAAWLANP